MKIKIIYCLIICTLIPAGKLSAQSIHEVTAISLLNGTVEIDGKVDETTWFAIDPLPLTMHWPNFQGEITEKTEIRIAYDSEYLYLSAICIDSEPSEIQMTSFQRDGWGAKMDQIALLLDCYDDNENTLAFIVTPTGSRIDSAIKNDAQTGNDSNDSWNTYWTAKTTLNDYGWETEMRIPFSSLRFKEENGLVKMGLIAYHYIARKRELNSYPPIPTDWGFFSFAKASQAQTVSFGGIKNKRPWYISPYMLAGTGHHTDELDNGEFQKMNDKEFQVGLDVQHAISDNLNADFTVNTDFAQAEADDQVVNLSRFSLFLPEKRKFFLERASIFEFRNDMSNQLFHSRNIGINEGDRIPIWGGARLVGRLKDWDVGLLNMQSKEVGSVASENFGVLRLRKNVFNQKSYMGAMMTSRLGTDGYQNFAYGLDGIFNLFGGDYLQINLAQTQDTDDEDGIKGLDRSRLYLMWEKRIIKGFGYKFSYSHVGNDYNPGLGFERRKNFSQIGDKLFYSWFAPENSNLRQTTITLNGGVSFNNFTSNLETSTIGLDSKWEWERGSSVGIAIEKFRDVLPEEFDLSDEITIDPEDYSNTTGTLSFSTPQVNFTSMETKLKVGTFYGGNLVSASITPQIVFSKYFQLSGFYEYNTIDFPDLNETFKAHVARLSLMASFNVKLSMSAFVQVNTLQKISAINFRLRYNPVDGNNLYLVYNDVLNNDPRSHIPRLPSSDTRALMLKYIHTLKL